ncbi:MAG: glycosyltransferase family 2 protein [Acidimicrobiales bacterium]
MPTVTIGIPTRNRADRLTRAVASALAQDQPVEVIVCDNASTDATQALMEATAGIRYIRHAADLGAKANFQSALDAATSEYFMWLADDDWLDPGYISACLEVLRDEVVLAAGDARYHWGSDLHHEFAAELTGAPWRRLLRYYRTVASNGTFYGVTRTDLRRNVVLLDTLAGDWLHVARLAAQGQIRRAKTTIHRERGGASDNSGPATMRSFVLPIMRAVYEDTRGQGFGRALSGSCAVAVWWNWSASRRIREIAVTASRRILPQGTYRHLASVRRSHDRRTVHDRSRHRCRASDNG